MADRNPKQVYWRVRRYIIKTTPSLIYRFAVDVWIRDYWQQRLKNYTNPKVAREDARAGWGGEKLSDHDWHPDAVCLNCGGPIKTAC